MNSLFEVLQNVHFISLLIGAILLVMGFITLKFQPKKINMIYGYRTARSMKNQENWDFAQKFATREMLRGGWIMIAFSFTGLIYPTSTLVETITGTMLMTVIFIVLIVRTERNLKQFENSSKQQ